MKAWKRRVRQALVLVLTAALVGTMGNAALQPVLAAQTEPSGTEKLEKEHDKSPEASPEEDKTSEKEATKTQEIKDGQTDASEADKTDSKDETEKENTEKTETDNTDTANKKTEDQQDTEPSFEEEVEEQESNPKASQEENGDEESETPEEEAPEEFRSETVEFTTHAEEELPDSEELFLGYAEQVLYPNQGIELFGNVGGDRLSGDSKTVYDTLKANVSKVAAGEETNTDYQNVIVYRWTASELGVASINRDNFPDAYNKAVELFQQNIDADAILTYLVMDCPYELYWFDRTVGMSCSYRAGSENGDLRMNVSFSFAVASEYQGNSLYTVDHSKIATVNAAAQKAGEIVSKYAGRSDYEKLDGYRKEICDLVSYNQDATTNTAYGNPWQLIWVFDGDATTNVVCEGYSKAFQYLCDLSTFSDAVCYTVTGTMSAGSSPGPHMWNIVTLEGENYLVDVTNCDGSAVGAPDRLFLAGTDGSPDQGYVFPLPSGKITYTYAEEEKRLLGDSILTLSSQNYKGKLNTNLQPVTVTYGDAVNSSVLQGTASSEGQTVPGAFSWAEGTAYGNAGTKTLYAVFTPNDQETYKVVTNIPVTVTVNPKTVNPTLRITGTYIYTGSEITPSFTFQDENGKNIADYTMSLSNNLHAGTATLFIRPKQGGNYTWEGTKQAEFTIAKGVYAGEVQASTTERYGRTGTFDFASMLPEGYRLGEMETTDIEGILKETPVLEGTILTYVLTDDRTKGNNTASVVLPVIETRNYEPFQLTLTIHMSDKQDQTGFQFEANAQTKTYGDAAFQIQAQGAAEGSTVTYTSSEASVAAVDNSGNVQLLNVGSTEITAWASETEDYFEAKASYTLTVVPRTLSWDVSGLTAVDKEGAITNNQATLYGRLSVAGLLAVDGADVTFDCPADQLLGTYAGITPGEQKVRLSWANPAQPVGLQGAKAGNYVLPEVLPELTGKINAVTINPYAPAEATEEYPLRLEVETGISKVPDAFKDNPELNTPAKIEAQMKLNIQKQSAQVAERNIAVYDVVLMVYVEGEGWREADKENFPANGLTITLSYPQGTGKDTHEFVASHLFTVDMNGHKAGEVENPSVTKTEEGLQFKVYGLSPVAIGWGEIGTLNSWNRNQAAGTQVSANAASTRVGANPATSDNSPIVLYAVLLVVAGCGIGYLYVRQTRQRRKRKNKKH